MLNILVPVFVLSALTFVPFAFDEEEPEKIAIGIAVILGFMFVQGIVAELLPKSQLSPNLANYIASVILLSALSVIANLICYAITLNHHMASVSPGLVVRIVFLKMLGFLLYPSEWAAAARRYHNQKKSNARVHVAVQCFHNAELQTQARLLETTCAKKSVKSHEVRTIPSKETRSRTARRQRRATQGKQAIGTVWRMCLIVLSRCSILSVPSLFFPCSYFQSWHQTLN